MGIMDTKNIRFKNILFLADKHGRERIADCDERKIWTINYINQLCGGFANIGARTARRIETGLNLPFGWIDVPHPEITYSIDSEDASNSDMKTQLLTLWEKMTPEDRTKLLKIGTALYEQ